MQVITVTRENIKNEIVSFLINMSNNLYILDSKLVEQPKPYKPYKNIYNDENLSVSLINPFMNVVVLGELFYQDLQDSIELEVDEQMSRLHLAPSVIRYTFNVFRTSGHIRWQLLLNTAQSTQLRPVDEITNDCTLVLDTCGALKEGSVDYKLESFVNYDKVLDIPTIQYNKSRGMMDNLYLLCGVTNNTVQSAIDFPIYEEKWCNINPITGTLDIQHLLFGSNNRPCTGNVCMKCKVKLFDYIYVLEYETIHICICRRCVSSYHITNLYKKYSGFNMLKVKHPMNLSNVLDEFDISDDYKNILIELSERPAILNGTVTTTNYKGYTDLMTVLARPYINSGDRVFKFEL